MTSSFKIHLRPNERIYINGAVVRVDRRVSLEFLNNVTFLLETHVMQEADATTPTRQLYFVVQSMIIDPATAPLAQKLFVSSMLVLRKTVTDAAILNGLDEVELLVESGRSFDALKAIRGLISLEDEILRQQPDDGLLEREQEAEIA
ncbi:putative flagellum biosynthesis repressor protein FlbT [Candidatus Filomicrobium marinum]|uniref:Flagellar protein FlbT n=2 Tax=Filomicrobium TaxID=119044 RepID=A0A1H0NNW7_9HYPH|nr:MULTISPECIES: flagellar biosynthesis repressor FlbT [Filomicrobium]MCV0371590.1 flagellar biosynthesis repressor FlbT [Filomicrobium sp.]CFX54876.1 putative flagellum biosynthesis repressor protein FlbT [Candidatus Filomicrobium marinum]CPR22164.1 putative flagellum biosynthesis repressor protein FlbT [Candidatus Filomicrobium marinum]SDO94462.1 flagellar protein FlbT [Filomicrobium insigne]